MLRLRTFGGLSIERPDDPSPGTGATSLRRRLALLAVLAANEGRGVPRDRLLALFWPESDSERARHSLDQSLYALKRELRADDLFVGREELSLNPQTITSDVADFRAALARGERAAAIAFYAGPFLDGVFVVSAPEFERWAEAERERLGREAEGALEGLASEAATRGDHRRAVEWWQRLAAMDPRKTRVVVALMAELAASGDRAGALRQAEVYQTLARDDLEVEPNPAVAALADRLKREAPAPSASTLPPTTIPPTTVERSTVERSTVAPSTIAPSTIASSTIGPSTVAASASPLPSVVAPSSMPPSASMAAPSPAGASPVAASAAQAPAVTLTPGSDATSARPFAGRYLIAAEIGRGGTATVYLARDLRNERRVALKVLRPELAAGIGIERFRQEITVSANLQHPHILPVHDSGEAEGTLFLVMPYVEGESLRARLDREGRLSVSEGVSIAQQIAGALAYAHARGIVHRDVKPENILLTSGHAVVCDFGLARALEGSAVSGGRRRTAPGVVVGTPAYLSPEQASGDPDVDARSDQYTLAYLLYEMLAGAPPFGAPDVTASPSDRGASERGAAVAAPLRSRRSDVPEHVDRAIRRALSADPSARFDDMGAFATALAPDGALDTPPGAARPTIRTRWQRRAPRSLAIGLGAVGVLAAGGLVLRAARPPVAERAWIVVADVENRTRDSSFDRAVDAALAAGLQQSTYVTIVPRARLQQALATMGRDTTNAAATRLTEATAREVAQRQGIAAVVGTTVDRVGDGYLLTTRLVDATSGATLAAEEREAKRYDDVIGAVDEIVRRLRADIGESRAAIARHDRPLPQATTRSLAALRKYADGVAAFRRGQTPVAMALWNDALAMDSDFALVHAELGARAYFENDRPRGDAHFAHALRLADRLTDRERFIVRAAAASWRGDREGAIELRRALLAEYPDDPGSWGRIGYDYMRLGRYREAADALQRQLARDSSGASDWVNLAIVQEHLDQREAAIRSYRHAFAIAPAYLTLENLNHEYGEALVMAGRVDEARSTYELMLRGTADQRARGERSLAFLSLYLGRYADATDRFRRAAVLSHAPRRELTEARNRLLLAMTQQRRGSAERDSARGELRAAHALFRQAYFEPKFLMFLGKELARDGQLAPAREVLDSLRRRAQPNNAADRANVDVVAGEIALAERRADSALTLFRLAAAIEPGSYYQESVARALAAHGDALAAARVWDAIAPDEKDWYGAEEELYGLAAPLEAARLYERTGDTANARRAYQAMLARWKAPDADLALVLEARDGLRRLGGASR